MADLQAKLQTLSDEFSKLQSDLQTQISIRQTLSSQEQENLSVQAEFSTLKEHNTVYKLIGPVLLKQDQEEAKMSVESRLGYIQGEIKRVEGLIKDLQDGMEKKRGEIVSTQIALQGGAK
ncbi:uncharacterized protein PV09_07615 [Verruconis gallopava]|uniref:Prefoldin, beta subunit n=1 Tax=Verruconis gallopava TaxID=253628 RepID=A0A0D2A266_9PEZI|nr:uncharacterized protein PV09_07615 [Verruconis gallopava]KIW00858.1 hypothetical protein PV09_07615 [Verruconis gallopava]